VTSILSVVTVICFSQVIQDVTSLVDFCDYSCTRVSEGEEMVVRIYLQRLAVYNNNNIIIIILLTMFMVRSS